MIERTLPLFLSSTDSCPIGGPGNSNFFSIPRIPREKIALSAKYGFISAPGTRISSRVAAGGTDGGEIIRMEAARES